VDPVGQRDVDDSLGHRGVEFSTGQRGVEFSTGQREADFDVALLSAGARRLVFGAEVTELAALSTGQRDVALAFAFDSSTGQLAVLFFVFAFEASTGQRDVALSGLVRLPAIPPASDLGFGGAGGFSAAARARADFAAALFASNRGGSVCFLT
jgi:hypothetical protein